MRRTTPSGLIVLDNGCYKRLVQPAVRSKVLASAKAAGLEVVPSTMNVLELLKLSDPYIRKVRLTALNEIRTGRPLLPWPYHILELVGQAFVDGRGRFRLPHSGFEWAAEDPDSVTDAHTQTAEALLGGLEQSFDEAHQKARPELQAFLRGQDKRDPWGNAPTFLDEVWMKRQMHEEVIEAVWTKLGFTPPAPIDLILASDVWRFLFKAWGVAIYERAIVPDQLKWVQLSDLIQLTYLGGTSTRILVTADKAFLRSASAVLHGRYPGSRVLYIDEWLSLA